MRTDWLRNGCKDKEFWFRSKSPAKRYKRPRGIALTTRSEHT